MGVFSEQKQNHVDVSSQAKNNNNHNVQSRVRRYGTSEMQAWKKKSNFLSVSHTPIPATNNLQIW